MKMEMKQTIESVMKPIYRCMRKKFVPLLPSNPKKISHDDVKKILESYWNNATDVVLQKKLINTKSLESEIEEKGRIDEILNDLLKKNLIYKIEVGAEAKADKRIILTPLGICFLSCYEKEKSLHTFEKSYIAGERWLGRAQNLSILSRLSGAIAESEAGLSNREKILSALILFSGATSEDKTLRLEKAPSSSDKIYKYEEELLESSELLSKKLLGTSSSVFTTIDDFDNAIRNRKRIKKRLYGLLECRKLNKNKGYQFFFQIKDNLKNLQKITEKILEGADESRRDKIISFLEEYMENQGALFKRSVRTQLLADGTIGLDYLLRLRELIKGANLEQS